MKFYIVKKKEFSGWECDGHMQTYIVAANSEEEAIALFPLETWETKPLATELELPDLKRKKKAFVVV